MFAVSAVHDPKSKSTQSICTDSAIACSPSIDNELAKLTKFKSFDNIDSRKSSDTTLAEGFRDLHLTKELDTCERSFSIDSSLSLIDLRVQEFNATLSKLSDSKVYVIDCPKKLTQLLDLHYSCDNIMPLPTEIFPYLHGPPTLREKVYFDDRFDPSTELDFLSQSTETILSRFPMDSYPKPSDRAFHLMTVNSRADENPHLVNSVVIEDLLVPKEKDLSIDDTDHVDLSSFELFKNYDQFSVGPSNPSAQTNRNYKSQTKLMAPLSHFLVYNNDSHLINNMEVAKVLDYLAGPDSNKNIYVVDFAPEIWPEVERFYVPSVQATGLDKETQITNMAKASSGLGSLEQNLIWSIYSISEVFPRLYVGSVLSFKQLISSREKAAQYDFKLFIYCHENAQMPSLASLRQTLHDLESPESNKPIFLEFSDSILRQFATLSKENTLAYLNLLRVLNIIVNKCHRNVFIYSYDGFSSTSLLLLSLGLFWGCDHIEEVSLCLFRKAAVKFHLCPGDFMFLKNLEVYVQWFKRQSTKDTGILSKVPLDKIYATYRPYNRQIDWFRSDGEVNFPAFIYESLLLGSVAHASSLTVLAALHVTNVISIGEKPRWYSALNSTFSHEATPTTTGPIIEPIFRFNNGCSLVYEIKVTSPAMRAHLFRHDSVPMLKSFIYIHGVEDDGRDSMYQLMADCPEWVQEKLFVSPADTGKTLVHCRIGVSRSATLAIAAVMKHFQMSLIESFLYVRVRRFNVVIQPNLRLFYELFLYDQHLRLLRSSENRGSEVPPCWWTLCGEIYRLNQQYTG